MKKIKPISIIAAAFVALFGGVSLFTQTHVSAADHTVSPGESIQVAINAAASGDTIILNAGTYNERLRIAKPITLKANGAVVINTKDSTNINTDTSVYPAWDDIGGDEPAKGIAIISTTNVTIQGITVNGEDDVTPKQTGIDIVGATNTTLTGVVVKNYAKNGISVLSQLDAERPQGSGIALNNVTVDNADWAGIAFYSRGNGNGLAPPNDTAPINSALRNVTFSGVTAVSNTAYGIQFGDSTNVAPIEGVNGGPVALGTVVFAGNAANISQDVPSLASITLENDSTIDGVTVTSADFAGLSVTLVEPVVIPGVPNTAIAR